MQALDAVSLVLRHRMTDLTKKSLRHQATTHPDLPMNAPDCKVNPFGLESFAPGQHVLVDAIHQGPIQIKQEGEAIVCHYESMNN
jgi:hypothetical protein